MMKIKNEKIKSGNSCSDETEKVQNVCSSFSLGIEGD